MTGISLGRLRRTPALRAIARETELAPHRLVQPIFVAPGGQPEAIAAMPGIRIHPADEHFDRELARVRDAGVTSVLLFGGAGDKHEDGRGAWAADGALQRSLRRGRASGNGVALIADLCLCAYTSHGHCQLYRDGAPDQAATLAALGRIAVSLAEAGAHVVAPSGMVDGMVAAIRGALDDAGFADRSVLSYAVKYASALYGPFREAVDSVPAFGDRCGYQLDPANVREGVREARQDQREGADLLMVKPALSSLDVIRAVREATDLPLLAYSVSGEYAMIKAAAAAGWLDERKVVLELLGAIRRAGADAVVTYHATDAAGWLREAA
jgi:porphobilinogen synthase